MRSASGISNFKSGLMYNMRYMLCTPPMQRVAGSPMAAVMSMFQQPLARASQEIKKDSSLHCKLDQHICAQLKDQTSRKQAECHQPSVSSIDIQAVS